MVNESSEKNVFTLKEVLRLTACIYKKAFKPIIILSLTSSILSIFWQVINYSGTYVNKYMNPVLVYILFLAINLTINVYFNFRIYMSAYILTDNYYDDKNMSAREAYKYSGSLVLRFIGTNLLFGLIFTIPLVGFFLSYSLIDNILIKGFTAVLFLVIVIVIFIKYYFATVSAVLITEKHRYFAISSEIVKGVKLKIFLILLLSIFVFLLPYQLYTRVLFDINTMSEIHRLIARSVNQILLLFANPFSQIVTVVMYRKLLTLKGFQKE